MLLGAPSTSHQTIVKMEITSKINERGYMEFVREEVEFRFQGKRLFITIPRTELTKETFVARCKEKYGQDLAWVVAAEEEHKDKGGHLHAVIEWKAPRSIRGFKDLDELCGKHGNYRRTNSDLYKLIRYVTKDGNYLSSGLDVSQLLAKQKRKGSGKWNTAVSIIEQNPEAKRFKLLRDYDKGFYAQNLAKLGSYSTWYDLMTKDDYGQAKQWIPLPAPESETAWDKHIREWLNSHIKKDLLPSNVLPQLWIVGRPGVGKSTFLSNIERVLNCYRVSDDKWYGDYRGEDHLDLIIADEWTRSMQPSTWLKQMADGFPMKLKVRNQIPRTKRKALPMIVCSNHSIHNLYKGVVKDALNRRFKTVVVTGKIMTLFEKPQAEPVSLECSEDEATLETDPTLRDGSN